MLRGPLVDEVALKSVLARVDDINAHLLYPAALDAGGDVPECAVPPRLCMAASDETAEAFLQGEVARTDSTGVTK